MKITLGSALVSSITLTLLFPVLTRMPTVRARTPQSMAPGANFNCSSENGRRRYCPANTRGGVQLIRQRSGSPCTFGHTWGFDRGGVWVDRGCRADFAIGFAGGGGGGGSIPNWPGWGNNYNVYCASDNFRRNLCPVDTRAGVRLVRQRSGSPCSFGSTWGWNRSGIWVDRGCRADFEIGSFGWQPPQNNVVSCASNNMQRNFCPANTRGGVRIIRQRSDSDCIFNRTWGLINAAFGSTEAVAPILRSASDTVPWAVSRCGWIFLFAASNRSPFAGFGNYSCPPAVFSASAYPLQ